MPPNNPVWTATVFAGMGQDDTERMFEDKLDQVVRAKELARDLEAEYQEMLEAASASGHHPRAQLRLGIQQANRELLNAKRTSVVTPLD